MSKSSATNLTRRTVGIQSAKRLISAIAPSKQAIILIGPPGCAKSAIVQEIADEQYGGNLIDVRLSQMDPVETKGIPMPNGDTTKWLRPDFLPVVDPDNLEGTEKGILFLDEFTCATPAVLNSMLQLVNDRKIGTDYTLPDGWVVIAAANLAEHGAHVTELSAPMHNRYVHVYVEPSWDDTKDFYVKAGVRPEILAYLEYRPDHLFQVPERGQHCFPTPRSWHILSNIWHTAVESNGGNEISPIEIGELAAASVGSGTSVELRSFLSTYNKIFPDRIINNGEMPNFSSEPSLYYAAVMSVAYYFVNKVKKYDKTVCTNFLDFADTLPPEFQLILVRCTNFKKNSKIFPALLKSDQKRVTQFATYHLDAMRGTD